MKKVIAMLLVAVMIMLPFGMVTPAYAVDTMPISLVATAADNTVTVQVIANQEFSFGVLDANVKYNDEVFTRNGTGTFNSSFDMGYEAENDGFLMVAKNVDEPPFMDSVSKDTVLATYTFTYDEEAAAGDYIFTLTLTKMEDGDYGSIMPEETTATATITINAASGGEESTDPAPYELFYELVDANGAAIAVDTDGYIDVDPGDTVTAAIKLKAEDTCLLQGYVVGITNNEFLTDGTVAYALGYAADKYGDAALSDDGSTIMLQYVGYDLGENIAAGGDITLAKITYTVSADAVYDDDLAIGFIANVANTAKGNSVAVGKSITHYQPTPVAGNYSGVEIKTEYDVEFTVDGVYYGDTQKVGHNKTVTAPQDPGKTGYTFEGWMNGNTAYDFNSKVTSNLTLTAAWEPASVSYTVKYMQEDLNGDYTIVHSEKILSGSTGDQTAAAALADDIEGFTAPTSIEQQVIKADGSTVVYVNYTRNSYNLTWDFDNGSADDTISVKYGATITEPTEFTKEGHTFKGWSPEVADTMPAEDTTYTAQWAAEAYTIIFNSDGGSEVASITKKFGEQVDEPTKPTKTGYTFANWKDESGATVTFPVNMPADGMSLTAVWTPIEYDIEFDVGGGTPIPSIKNVKYGEPVALPEATREGYKFKGWAIEENGEVKHLAGAKVDLLDAAGTKTLYAVWEVGEYIITFENTGDSTIQPIVGNFGDKVDAPANPTKAGYTFAGWDVAIPETMPAKDMTITAQWTINQYTITFVDTGDVAYESITQDYNTDIATIADPVKTGYTFAGWDVAIPETMPAKDMTITATWTINQYTITFANTGDSTIAPIKQDYATAINAPADPTKTGYTFAGWDAEIPTTMPAKDMTITATWTINQYTITFANTGDSTIAPITADYGTAVTKPTNPTKAGYTFAGWDATIPATMPAGDMTITAQWEAKSYTITYEGTNITLQPQTYTIDGDGIAATATSVNYSLEWEVTSVSEEGNWSLGEKINPSDSLNGKYGNVTLTAVWTSSINFKLADYWYACTGDKLLVVDAIGVDTANESYQVKIGDTWYEMYYSDNASYCELIGGSCTGVYLYIVTPDEGDTFNVNKLKRETKVNADALAARLLKGDVNGNGYTDLSDANAVYQMVKPNNGAGSYYDMNTLDVLGRLVANMNSTGDTKYGSVDDAKAIVDILNG